ncbi:hypothetical protein ATANTOWER_028198 [Ataeniobius toweri]|uniref:Secreted protein n=1 Tax=Ataeniobius toweri TaxID=208326 RepID=A0ABU7BAA9_9TELE|nr:hypothetical protein [Ataeniobius toweri]
MLGVAATALLRAHIAARSTGSRSERPGEGRKTWKILIFASQECLVWKLIDGPKANHRLQEDGADNELLPEIRLPASGQTEGRSS